jgi:hypothetical protein
VHIILCGDSPFYRDESMDGAGRLPGGGFVFGVARNHRLRRLIAPQLVFARARGSAA